MCERSDRCEIRPPAAFPPLTYRDIDDPRPDSPDDSERWRRLRLAFIESDDLFGALHVIRCRGARLEVQHGRPKITPLIDPWRVESDWATEDDWQRDLAAFFVPHRDGIARVAADRLGRVAGSGQGATSVTAEFKEHLGGLLDALDREGTTRRLAPSRAAVPK